MRAMHRELTEVLRGLFDSYQQPGGINYISAAMLPSKSAIARVSSDLLGILFPGFHGEPLELGAELPPIIQQRVESIYERLKLEMSKTLHLLFHAENVGAKADEILTHFMSQLLPVRQLLWTDIEAAFEGDPAATRYEEVILSYPAIEAIATQRLAHILYKADVPLIPRMMTEWAHSRTGIDIHPGAQIGSHFFIDHGTGVVIGETCEIGSHVKLYHAVTLGAKSFQKDEHGQIKKGGKRHPKVEDGVTIYPNSTVLGGETVIGARSTIGGNVFLMETVPPDSLVFYEEKQLKLVPKFARV